jgi:hypothetical protein
LAWAFSHALRGTLPLAVFVAGRIGTTVREKERTVTGLELEAMERLMDALS